MKDLILRLLIYLSNNIRVDKETVKGIVDDCDVDKDGYISLAEMIGLIREWWRAHK